MSDAELTRILTALENLPEELKHADPRTTPNYEQRLSEALHGMCIGGSPARKLYGGEKGIWRAIRYGWAAADIGEEGAKFWKCSWVLTE
ncbi:hypothetical protein ACU21_08785 [Actinobaculum suis]|nr:hypothetical protein ACU20_08560 [Actinobaculum suis]OCA94215.1 hypothetical protein ACU21_08785 [Actinobaculum suis]